MKNVTIILFVLFFGFGFIGCRKTGTIIEPDPILYPIANAGNYHLYSSPLAVVRLDGSSSYDPGGLPLSFAWKIVSGPEGAILDSPNQMITTISNLQFGQYWVELNVTNSKARTTTASTSITIYDNTRPNYPPNAVAFVNQQIVERKRKVTLIGSHSIDEFDVLSYTWKLISGPSGGTIDYPDSMNTNFSNFKEGIYEFELEVKDSSGVTDRDQLRINILDETVEENESIFYRVPLIFAEYWGYYLGINYKGFVPPGKPLKALYVRDPFNGTKDWIDIMSQPDVNYTMAGNTISIGGLDLFLGAVSLVDVKLEF